MNEFIVWDNKENKFLIDKDLLGYAIRADGVLVEDNYCFEELPSNRFIFFRNIELKDINGKNIYADSSIVEYMTHGVHEFIKFWGTITYDKNNSCYVIKIKNQDDNVFPIGNIGSIPKFNIKIIDTIQENKLGLIK